MALGGHWRLRGKPKRSASKLLLSRENLMGKFFSEKKKIQRFEQFITRELYYQASNQILIGRKCSTSYDLLSILKQDRTLSCINKSRFEVYPYFDHFLIVSMRFCCNNLINLCFFMFLLASRKVVCRIGAVMLYFDIS